MSNEYTIEFSQLKLCNIAVQNNFMRSHEHARNMPLFTDSSSYTAQLY